MKASLKGRYDINSNGAAATVGVNAGELRLRASITDATFVKGPSLNGLALSVEKPGFFILDYNVPKKDFRFQFMNTVRVSDKKLNTTYIHSWGENRTVLEVSLVIDPANKFSANYLLGPGPGPGHCKLKYTYVHKGLTTFEPSYDMSKNVWDFAVSRNVYGDDVLKATYHTSSKALGLEWSRNAGFNGCFKVSAALNLDEKKKMPKLSAESTWNFDM